MLVFLVRYELKVIRKPSVDAHVTLLIPFLATCHVPLSLGQDTVVASWFGEEVGMFGTGCYCWIDEYLKGRRRRRRGYGMRCNAKAKANSNAVCSDIVMSLYQCANVPMCQCTTKTLTFMV